MLSCMNKRSMTWRGLGCMALGLLMSCAPKGTHVDPGSRQSVPPPTENTQAAGTPNWFPHAVDLRLHPATRFTQEEGTLRLKARVELLDQMDEPIKDVGRFVCELAQVDEDGNTVVTSGGRRRVLHWEFDVKTLQEHETYWDPVARAYLLPLNIPEEDHDLPHTHTQLLVTFRPAWPGADVLPTGQRGREPIDIRGDR